jgi:hypothetical protein
MTTYADNDTETWPDNGEQDHEACLFQAGPAPSVPIVSASLLFRRNDGIFFFMEHATRQSAVDYLASTDIPNYTAQANAYAATSKLPQVFMGSSPGIQVILVQGTAPPPAEQMTTFGPGPKRMTKTILIKPSQLSFIDRAWADIATGPTDKPHVYKLV